MKVYTKVEYQWVDGCLELVHEEFYEHDGGAAECKGGGSSGQTQTWEASDKYAALSRQQFEDVKERFYPYHEKLIAQTNGATQAEEIKRSTEAVSAASDRQRHSMDLGTSRMGVTKTADQNKAVDRSFGLNKAAALANAKNKAREKVEQRDLAVNTGGMGAINAAKTGAA